MAQYETRRRRENPFLARRRIFSIQRTTWNAKAAAGLEAATVLRI
jgi:hypothetical protein